MAPERIPHTSSNRGLMIMEAVVSMFVLTVIMGGIVVALHTQTEAARRSLTRARCRLLLDGELEVMRGRISEIKPCQDEEFQPALGTPKGFKNVVFHRSVELQEGGRLARVKLWTTRQVEGKPNKWMSIRGLVFLEGGQKSATASK